MFYIKSGGTGLSVCVRNRGPRASVSLENRHYLIFLITKLSNESSHRSRRVLVPSRALHISSPQMRWQAEDVMPKCRASPCGPPGSVSSVTVQWV